MVRNCHFHGKSPVQDLSVDSTIKARTSPYVHMSNSNSFSTSRTSTRRYTYGRYQHSTSFDALPMISRIFDNVNFFSCLEDILFSKSNPRNRSKDYDRFHMAAHDVSTELAKYILRYRVPLRTAKIHFVLVQPMECDLSAP